jgi:hypothetical protein
MASVQPERLEGIAPAILARWFSADFGQPEAAAVQAVRSAFVATAAGASAEREA